MMSQRSETFGRLLKGAINSIAAYEGKTAPVIEDELGAQIGVAGSSIQRYKAGYLPTEPRAVQILAEAAVRRGFLSRAWLQRFLQAARYPAPETLISQLAESTGQTDHVSVERGLPSGTLTFLFTDIEGSTARWERQPQAMERALARHDELLRQAIDAYGGQVVKTIGDAFQAVFTTAPDALEAALAAQRALQAEAWGPIEPIRARMALHVGVVQQRDGDYFGHSLNRVARLCAAGHGGQLLLSNAAQELVHDALPPGTELCDLGEHQLKDLARRERIFQVVAPGLPADFPPLRTLERYTHNLPAHSTPFIGREAEVQAVVDLFRREGVRLVTLTGPGGIGKTRLALQAAAELLDDFRDGVYFVPLATLHDPDLVPAALAQVLGVKELGDQPLHLQIAGYLHKKRTLLVFDNFEQVAAAGSFVAELLAGTPGVKVLVTSREVLHLYGEHEYSVPSLRLPDLRRLPPIERLTQYEAVRLFIERAQAVRPELVVTSDNAPAIAEICCRLDGLPLALELAAARSKLFPPKALLARLDKRLALLTGGARDLPARQQTLRQAIAWSYDLLDAAEQALFARLAVFVGGCSLAAAEAVLADNQANNADELTAFISGDAVLDGLTSLVDKNLLKQAEGQNGELRFVMLETIREYARTQLVEQGDFAVLQRRHAAYFLQLAEAAESQSRGTDQIAWAERLEVDHDNFRAGLTWAHDEAANDTTTGAAKVGLRLAGALFWFWSLRNYLSEGRRWLDEALADARGLARTAAEATALFGSGALALAQTDQATGRLRLEASVALWRELGDKRGLALSLSYDYSLGWANLYDRRAEAARALFAEGVALWRELGDSWGLAWALLGLGAAVRRDDAEAALPIVQESVARFREVGDRKGLALSLMQLAIVARHEGDLTRSATLYEEALAISYELGVKDLTTDILQNFGEVVQTQGDHRRALTLYRESLTMALPLLEKKDVIALCVMRTTGVAEAIGQPEQAARLLSAGEALLTTVGLSVSVWPEIHATYQRYVAALRAQLDEEAFMAAWAEGRTFTWEQAVAEALTLNA